MATPGPDGQEPFSSPVEAMEPVAVSSLSQAGCGGFVCDFRVFVGGYLVGWKQQSLGFRHLKWGYQMISMGLIHEN